MTDMPPPEPDAVADRDALEQALGYRFRDHDLLRRALTHASSTADKTRDNERLEFFGDAILDMIVCEYLYHHCPRQREGDLSEVRSAVVRKSALAAVARDLPLRPHLVLGRGMARRAKLPASVYANVFEALTAAVYLDGGYEAVRDFVLKHLEGTLEDAQETARTRNYKSMLQQCLQREGRDAPAYRVLSETGPDHAKSFEVASYGADGELGRGAGNSKKEGEQAAARDALQRLYPDVLENGAS